MNTRRNPLAAEEVQGQECGFQKKREDSLGGQRSAENVAHEF